MARNDTDDRLKSIPIFSELSKKELRTVSRLMTAIDVKEGRSLTRQGEVGREFMIIAEGTAVVRRGGRKIAELGKGDFLGELAVLSGARAPPMSSRRPTCHSRRSTDASS